MKEFRIDRDVTSANGTQSYKVMAKDEAEAREKFQAGDGEFIDEEVMVDDLASVQDCDVYEI